MKQQRQSISTSSLTRHPSSLSWLSDFALYASIALVLARAMMLEILREPMQVEVGQAAIPRGPGPATGLVLDMLCCVPALLVLLRASVDRTFPIHRSLAHLLMLLLGLWTIASPVWASDKFAAAVSAAHFVAGLVMLWTFSQLVRAWRQLRLIAASAFGLLLVLTAQGLIYRFVDLPDLHRSIERDWPQILAERGWEADSFIANQFKKRIMGGEVMGFSASPNTLGASLVMLGIVSVGLLVQRIRDRDESGWALVIGLALLPTMLVLWFTGSRTALATPILAGTLLLIFWNARSWMASHRKLVFFGSVLLILICTGAVVAHGIYHGTLFHDSLTFRWKYWIGAWRIFIAHPVVGVGFANFGLYYLGTRLPEAAEEINDPHNFVVRVFVELGLIGGAILIAWMLRLWWELSSSTVPNESRPAKPARTNAIAPLLWLAAASSAIATFTAVDFAQQWQYGFIEVLKRLLYGTLLLVGLVVGTVRSAHDPQPDERPAPWVLSAMLAAIAVFLVHNLVDFSLFETGAMLVFMMLTGAALGIRSDFGVRAMSRAAAVSLAAAGVACTITFAMVIVAPVVIAESQAHLADAELRRGVPASAGRRFQRAFDSLWIPNADYAFRAARAMVLAGANPDDVRAMIDAASRVSPVSVRYPRMRAEFEMRMAIQNANSALASLERVVQLKPSRTPARVNFIEMLDHLVQGKLSADTAIAAFHRVVHLDPSDASTRIDFARLLERFGRREQAVEQYRNALELNEQLDPAEPERLTPGQATEMNQRIRALSK